MSPPGMSKLLITERKNAVGASPHRKRITRRRLTRSSLRSGTLLTSDESAAGRPPEMQWMRKHHLELPSLRIIEYGARCIFTNVGKTY